MFNSNDTSYKAVPKSMDITTSKKIVDSVYDYMVEKKLTTFDVILHGGEPFLWDISNFEFLLNYVAKMNNRYDLYLNLIIQTNGFKVNWHLIELLKEYNIPIGVSIDGPSAIHDKFRVTHNSKPTYDTIIENLYKIVDGGYNKEYIGVLSVVNPAINASQYFEWIKSLPINRINVLWPIEFNYNNAPWVYYGMKKEDYIQQPLYGKWFADLFSLWFKEDNPDIFIKSFYEIITLKLGSVSHSDSLVNDELSMFVVDTNGAIEYHDYFRAFKDRSIKTLYNIFQHPISNFEIDKVFEKCFKLKDQLPHSCTNCKQVSICGGGFLPGRMENSIEDFTRNNSVLCYDQKHFFERVESILRPAISQMNFS